MKTRDRPRLSRRRFVASGALAFVLPGTVLAQPRKSMPLVAVILAPRLPNRFMETLRQGLRELVALRPDVIVAGGGSPAVRAAMDATRDIPIVFPASGDPVRDGLVKSLARPGGNVTGTSILTDEMNAKRVELLKALRPGIKRAALLVDPKLRSSSMQRKGGPRC